MPDQPDIPVHLAGRQRQGGLVVPWITPAVGGVHLFGTVIASAQRACLHGRLCQVCGQRLPGRSVLFARAADLRNRCTVEPATCPACAAYSTRACPMLSRRRDHYRASGHPALAGLPPSDDARLRQAAPAEPWFAVWVRDYDVRVHPARTGLLAASWARIPPLTIRPLPTT
ncbi:hypothetical protein Ais01nite_73820 [Asanoa ishikariensis]|uniref:Uncharacterized protein n=1 Tax=Asanoa ishikariensis TaxID=137265 RepID=A0A1H3URN6_9ACTN|nr:hypothetical protein [Asanoa ishikariensis]GIF69347.1 hypothetical protein Ais01nite_73820 [Asanoa ishikariensis]SDZ65017.1 hypothetical protein SAMN05421684_7905 [Asanoa ishikariensis]